MPRGPRSSLRSQDSQQRPSRRDRTRLSELGEDGRQGDPPARQAVAQPSLPPGQPAAYRALGPAEPGRGVLLRHPLEKTEDHRPPVPVRQAVDLVVQRHPELVADNGVGVGVRDGRLRPHCHGPPFADPAPGGKGAGALRDPASDAVQPAPDRVLFADRPGPPQQDHHRRLERLLGVCRVPQQIVAGSEQHFPMSGHQGLKSLCIAVVDEPLQQLRVGRPRETPFPEQSLKIPPQVLQAGSGHGVAILLNAAELPHHKLRGAIGGGPHTFCRTSR
jgi:hypothetical protein